MPRDDRHDRLEIESVHDEDVRTGAETGDHLIARCHVEHRRPCDEPIAGRKSELFAGDVHACDFGAVTDAAPFLADRWFRS